MCCQITFIPALGEGLRLAKRTGSAGLLLNTLPNSIQSNPYQLNSYPAFRMVRSRTICTKSLDNMGYHRTLHSFTSYNNTLEVCPTISTIVRQGYLFFLFYHSSSLFKALLLIVSQFVHSHPLTIETTQIGSLCKALSSLTRPNIHL
jgi:hypothetical protein